MTNIYEQFSLLVTNAKFTTLEFSTQSDTSVNTGVYLATLYWDYSLCGLQHPKYDGAVR